MYISESVKNEMSFFRKANEHFEILAGKGTCKVQNAPDEVLYMAMTASTVMDYSEDGFFEDFVITDKSISGKSETQIDAYALIDTENSSTKHLHIFQYKLYGSEEKIASTSDLLGLATYISNFFLHPSIMEAGGSEYTALNEIREKCDEFLNARRNRKILISCHLITNTRGVTAANEKGINEVLNRFLSDKQLYGFNIQVYGANDIVELIKDGKIKVGDESLELVVDYTEQSYRLEDNSSRTSMGLPKKVIIGMCNINEFIRLQNKYHHNQLYSENIRLYLGDRGSVNKDIIRTITSTESLWFPYMNNGISIICDKLDVGSINQSKRVRGLTLTNMQIINGCQTVNALYSAKYSEQTKDNFRASNVLVRIYEIDPSQQDFKESIIKATNNQNSVKSYSLLANDAIQIELSHIFKGFGIIYDRKGEGRLAKESSKVISMVNAALAYRAVYLFMAKSLRSGLGKTRVFQKGEYEKVFDSSLLEEENNQNLVRRCAELYIASVLLDTVRELIVEKADQYVASVPIFKKSAYYLAGLVYANNKTKFDALAQEMMTVWMENNPAKMKGKNFWEKIVTLTGDTFDKAIEDITKLYVERQNTLLDIDNLLKSQTFADAYVSRINVLIQHND
jgi:hypothetical protein